ncbi:MAG TPA: HepT-like ribonuclease domain-containing protein [Opitutaceae bacterium]|nr:HepT-like ribonuclease domain-containing protein [Opitutaceae bacterium]
MARPAQRSQDAYLHDMLEAARLIRGYMAGVTFDEFWNNSEKRDAVALRSSVLGESAHKVDKPTEAALPSIPFKSIRGMRNRIAHDYGAVDFKIVWAVAQQVIDPLIAELEAYFKSRPRKR